MRVFIIVTALAAIFLISTSMGLPQGQKEALQEKIHRGQRLYQTYGCADCHQVLGKGGKGGPDLSRVTVWASPLLGAAVMWNHVKVMEFAMRERFLQWPEFKGGDITDIFTYLHSLNPQKSAIHLYPGEAPLGRETYGEVGCQTCHGEPFGGGHIGSDLGKIAWAS
jgi:mono/diheme cytochrome c family protein